MNQEFKNAWKEHNKSFWDNRQHNCDWITWCGGWMLYDGDLFRVKNF